MALAGIGLTGLIVAGLYQRYLVVTTDRAVIEAPDLPARGHRPPAWSRPATAACCAAATRSRA